MTGWAILFVVLSSAAPLLSVVSAFRSDGRREDGLQPFEHPTRRDVRSVSGGGLAPAGQVCRRMGTKRKSHWLNEVDAHLSGAVFGLA